MILNAPSIALTKAIPTNAITQIKLQTFTRTLTFLIGLDRTNER